MSDHTLIDGVTFRLRMPKAEGLMWRTLISNLETGGVLERIPTTSFKTRRWYCYANDELADCMGRTPQLYTRDEWDHDHDSCGWVWIETAGNRQFLHEDWELTLERKTRGD